MRRSEFILLVVALLLMSCDDIIEGNLEGIKVTILSPADSTVTTSTSVQFNWEELDEVMGYRIQVARPTFDQIEYLVYDSLIRSTTTTFQFNPGQYEWRIRPENGSSAGDYITRSITIDSTSDLTNQEIVLQFPSDDFVTNSTTIDFSWYELYNADQYSFLLKYDDQNGSLAMPEEIISGTTMTVTGLTEGMFAWGVRGEADLTNTAYSYRSFMVDLTEPSPSTLLAPINNTTTISPVLFEWNRPTDNGSNIFDSLFIYADDNLEDLLWSTKVTLDSVSHPLSSGTYYWRVKTCDVAGNQSPYTQTESFYVQ